METDGTVMAGSLSLISRVIYTFESMKQFLKYISSPFLPYLLLKWPSMFLNLDHLYMKLHEVCLVQGGEEEAYRMLIYLSVGSLLPYIESLDSWLYEGILHDPFNEMFFYGNKAVSINDAEFWEKSYRLRSPSYQKLDGDLSSVTHDANNRSLQLCPLFIREIAGKSFLLENRCS
ncbi:hypothetical protein Dimus_027775 [Dionaea muscipula]